MKNVSEDQHNRNVREVIAVRGIAAAIQAMHAPFFKNLDDLLRKEGYKLVKLTNKQETDESNR